MLPIGAPRSGEALPPWADEFDMRTLYVSLPENAGPVSEAAFYHRPTKSLVAVDAVVFVPEVRVTVTVRVKVQTRSTPSSSCPRRPRPSPTPNP